MQSVASFLSRLALGSESKRFSEALRVYKSGEHAEAFAALLPLAKNGHAEAQALLANMYRNGEGIAVDLKEAAHWTRLAAEQGDPVAQHNLGLMYHAGSGVTADLEESARWLRLAAEQGVAQARYNLGVLYEDGTGVPQDISEALRWYRLAAQFGNAGAQINLANCFHNGWGVVLDEFLAAWWMRLAADQGAVDAQLSLGIRYLHGVGISQNFTTAFFWFNLAANAGSRDAAQYLANLVQSMSPDHLNDAQATCEGSAWKPKTATESAAHIFNYASAQMNDTINQAIGEKRSDGLALVGRKIPSAAEVILEETRGIKHSSIAKSIRTRLEELDRGIDARLSAFKNTAGKGIYADLPAALAIALIHRVDDLADVGTVLSDWVAGTALSEELASLTRAIQDYPLALIGGIEGSIDGDSVTLLLKRSALRQALRAPEIAKFAALDSVLLPLLPW